MPTELTNKQIDLTNLTMYYLEGGTSVRSKYPILFLHGWIESAAAFRDSLNILSQNYRVIAPDLPGFGRSSHDTSSWGYDDYSQSIISFIKALGIEQVHLIGHSTGGGIGIVTASSVPCLIRSLILLDSTGIPIGSLQTAILRRLIELPYQALSTKFSPKHANLIGASLYNSLFRTKNTFCSLNLSLKVDLRPRLSKIQAPCLLLWGEKDITIPLSSGVEMSRMIKDSKLVVVQEGYHEWSLLRPREFASISSDFIESIEQK